MTDQQERELRALIERARRGNRQELRDELLTNLEFALAEIKSLQKALVKRRARAVPRRQSAAEPNSGGRSL